ncbi:DUF1439 domain-containing protein [Vibrio hannami]|uniref:DUF1439 domain-containing protein n=1 Tax=Vibrio hannami TaxID=2717094 RepID=UPI00240F07B2|nr:DUF1439 domain-containing protein [Vibrio hannami]MDG3086341.1 DUF1439 domain-containing protein [Vibrio hannami]
MFTKLMRTLPLTVFLLTLSGCASYSITEQEMTDYLQENVALEQSIGIQNIMHAEVAVDDLAIKIGRTDKDRISVFANTNAKVQLLSSPDLGLDLDLEFSAIPEYSKESGEVFLKSLRLEKFEERNNLLTPQIETFLKPAVAMISTALSNKPVYKLDSNKVQEAMLKSSNPNLVIKDNKLVIELFD